MSLVEEQWAFLQDVARLINYLKEQGLVATGGELWRTEEQQLRYRSLGLSFARRSKHQDRLAIDLNHIFDGKLVPWPEAVGAFWESLHPKNVWGGRWKKPYDPSHFERRL